MKINKNRVQELIEEFNQYTLHGEEGIHRLALSEDDQKARDLLKHEMHKHGLDTHIDPIGNMIGIPKHQQQTPIIAIGSHLDSVANGGKYDGVIGIVAGLIILETLKVHNFQSKKALALINFTNEEGNRFAPDMMGSAVFAGVERLESCYASIALDNSGETVLSALEKIGYKGSFNTNSLNIEAFLELHIEQGPILEQKQIPIGIVEKVQGIYWTEYIFEGVANHAGTTPMNYRRNAGLAAAELMVKAQELALQKAHGQVITVGKLEFTPNQPNIVPSKARMIIDQRNPSPKALEGTQSQLDQMAQELAQKHGLKLASQELARFQPVAFSDKIVSLLEDSAKKSSIPYLKMLSGAGHDAQLMAHRYPAAMVFVPSKDGISHNPAEHTDLDDIVKGIELMLNTVLRLL